MTSIKDGGFVDQQQAEDEEIVVVGIVPSGEPQSLSTSSSSPPQEQHHVPTEAAAEAGPTQSVENASNGDSVKSNNNRDALSSPSPLPSAPHVLNPRWREYFFIGLFSLVSLCSVDAVMMPADNNTANDAIDGNRGAGIAFGSVSFAIAILVAIHEYIHYVISQMEQTGNGVCGFHDAREYYDYKVLCGGKFEGSILAFLTLWWIIGVAYLTQVNGLAYAGSTNGYLSAWLSFAACVYTLYAWIRDNETLVDANITIQSSLVPAWCILAFASWVVMCTSIEMFSTEKESVMDHDDRYNAEAAFGISVGLLTFLLSLVWITLGHYYGNDDPTIPASSAKRSKLQCLELTLSGGCLVFWAVGVALLTRNGGLGGTVMGRMMPIVDANAFSLSNASDRTTTTDPNVTVGNVIDTMNATTTTAEFSAALYYNIPGSNLYVFVWTCFAASLSLVYQWILRQQQKQQQPQSPLPPPLSPPPSSLPLQRDEELHVEAPTTDTTAPIPPAAEPGPVEEHQQDEEEESRRPSVRL